LRNARKTLKDKQNISALLDKCPVDGVCSCLISGRKKPKKECLSKKKNE
jgi:hypothetical protein